MLKHQGRLVGGLLAVNAMDTLSWQQQCARRRAGRNAQIAAIASIVLSWLAVPAIGANPLLDPGQAWEFSTADNGGTVCRHDGQTVSCNRPRFLGTEAVPGTSSVGVVSGSFEDGETSTAIAGIFNEFRLSAATAPGNGGVVPARVSVNYDLAVSLLGVSLHAVDAQINLVVEDVTDPARFQPVASVLLAAHSSSGGQGLSDVSTEGLSFETNDESGSLNALLRRGRAYRITFQMVGNSFGAFSESAAIATMSKLNIVLDDDAFERISAHDDDVQFLVRAHDGDMRRLLEQHDRDVKDMLSEVGRRQEEIIRLLLTPQGRREHDLGSFPISAGPTAGAVSDLISPGAGHASGTSRTAPERPRRARRRADGPTP